MSRKAAVSPKDSTRSSDASPHVKVQFKYWMMRALADAHDRELPRTPLRLIMRFLHADACTVEDKQSQLIWYKVIAKFPGQTECRNEVRKMKGV